MRAPFPHAGRQTIVWRPALVLTAAPVGLSGPLMWTAMITNADHEHWPGDFVIEGAERLGLIIPSKVRTAKVTTIETKTASLIGTLPAVMLETVRTHVRSHLGL